MRIDLHDNAAIALDAAADRLTFKDISTQRSTTARPTGWGERHVNFSITDKDVIGISRRFDVDSDGNENEVAAHDGVHGILIGGDDYAAYEALIKKILEVPILKHKLSREFVAEVVSDWCLERLKSKEIGSFSEELLRKVRLAVSDRQLWIPVAYMQTQHAFEFGPVRIVTIPRAFFDEQERSQLTDDNPHKDDAKKYFAMLRSKLQGHAAVAMSIRAETRYARTKALQTAQDAVSLLRFFHPAAFDPDLLCATSVSGFEFVPKSSSLEITGVNEFRYSSSIGHVPARDWRISNEVLEAISDSNFKAVGNLIYGVGCSPFEMIVRNSIMTYTRGMTFPEKSDRLIYTLSALESVFLKDTSEPISQSLADRLSFVAYENIDDRIKTVSNCKKIYAARSQYVHHQAAMSLSAAELKDFFLAAWSALNSVIHQMHKFKRKEDFISAVDRMKYS